MSFCGPLVSRHKKGWTVAVYDASGEQIVSGGLDGKVKLSSTFDDPSPMEHVIGEKINAIVCRNDTIILATEGTHVHMIQAEDGLPDGVATRFTAEVNDITANRDRSKLASCSSDFMIKVVDFTNPDDREFILEGHKAPVLSVSFDPLDIFIASSSCDGTVRVWRVDQRKEVKCIRSLSPCTDPSLALSCCRLCWRSISGQFLAVPIDKEICLYERESWEVLTYLRCPSITLPITVCASSPDGSRLGAGCSDGWIIVWSVEDRSVLHRVKDASESSICSLSWHPHQETSVLVANKNGCIGLVRLSEPQANGGLSPHSMNALLDCDEDGDTDELLRVAAAQAESSRLMDEDDLVRKGTADAGQADASDDDDVHSIDLSRIKSGFMELEDDVIPDAAVVDKGAAIDPLNAAVKSDVLPVQSTVAPVPVPPRPVNRIQQPFQPGSMPLGFHERFMVWNRYGLVIQYRSTDADREVDEPDDATQASVGSIEVEFHDTTVHHSLRLSNTAGYTMADLSLTGLLLASPGTHDPSLADDADAGDPIDPSDISQIAVLPLDTAKVGGGDSSSEWTIKLPPGEACEAVCLVPNDHALSDQSEPGYAVVATSRRFLRIFAQPTPSAALLRSSASLHLFQITKLGLPPISLPYCGVVAMASHPSKPILGMVVTSATGELLWRLFYLGGTMLGSQRSRQPSWIAESLVTWQPLPISLASPTSSDKVSSPSAPVKLTWFGFSDFGSLYTHDASGVVRRLVHSRRGAHRDYHWVPVCDTHNVLKPSNRRSDNYFIVGVLESSEAPVSSLVTEHLATRGDKEASGLGQLQAIYCKASKWPRVFPRPVVCSLPFSLPLCSMDTDQGSLEDCYLRYLISEDWPTWGPSPRSPVCTLDTAEVDLTDVFQSLSSKCVTKRKGVLLRLFALAAKLESDWASLAIARLMPDAATVQLAIRYAGRLRRQHLAHRLAGIALEKERGSTARTEESSNDEQSSSDDEEPSPHKPTQPRVRSHYASPQQSSVRSNRHPSGTREEDLANVSLVSSATDDTHDEGHISGLPLPESEPMTQSFLSNTPSTTRNPFRDSATKKTNSVGPSRTEQTPRARGSEVLDQWRPSESGGTSSVGVDASRGAKKPVPSTKKRVAPVSVDKRRSKMAKSTTSISTSGDVGGFTEWFEANREQLEEEYPDQSVEELLSIAKKEFLKMKTKVDADCGADAQGNGKENELPDSQKEPSKKEKKSNFANKASKRLSSFKFDTD